MLCASSGHGPGIARVESGEAQQTLEMIYKIASAVGMTAEVVFRPMRKGSLPRQAEWSRRRA